MSLHKTGELTDIKGIGGTREQWLQAVDIDTIPSLLSIPAKDIESRLKAIGHNISLNEIINCRNRREKQKEKRLLPLL